MPFGILPVHAETQPPGTELLVSDDGEGPTTSVQGSHLKRVTVKGIDTILVPQPSDDPNDPLVWPRWRKEAAFIIILMNCVVFATLPGPVIGPSTVALSIILKVPLTKVAELSGYQLLVVGALGPIVSVLARKYGKRPQFLFAVVMGTIGTAVCIGAKTSYNTLLAGRILQGFGVTAWESLSLATIGDIFFLHERGWRTAVVVLTLACLASMVSIIGGVVAEHLGWRYLFIISLPFDLFGLLGTIFFLPETQFRRDPSLEYEQYLNNQSDRKTATEQSLQVNEESRQQDATESGRRSQSYLQSLRPFSGVYTDENPAILIIEIFIHLLNPAVMWILNVSAVLVSFFVGSAYILAQIYSAPPYNLNVEQNGFFYVGAFIGGLLAVSAGSVCDWSAQALARRNKGIYESEFRIPVNLIGALFMGLGWFLFMWDVNHPTPNGYYLGAFCHGCACFGISVTSTAAGLYILDSFPRQSTPIFILQMMAKNFIFYAFSTFINNWAATDGPGEVFKVFGIVSVVAMTTCIPMYVFGKRNRMFIHKHSGRFKLQ